MDVASILMKVYLAFPSQPLRHISGDLETVNMARQISLFTITLLMLLPVCSCRVVHVTGNATLEIRGIVESEEGNPLKDVTVKIRDRYLEEITGRTHVIPVCITEEDGSCLATAEHRFEFERREWMLKDDERDRGPMTKRFELVFSFQGQKSTQVIQAVTPEQLQGRSTIQFVHRISTRALSARGSDS